MRKTRRFSALRLSYGLHGAVKAHPPIFLQKNSVKVLTNDICRDIILSVADDICKHGSIAQLGEHLPYKQRVIGSSPIVPTIWPGSSVG